MRYIIETTQEGNEKSVWNSLNALKDKGFITIVEKGDPVEEMKMNLRKVARAMQILEGAGIDKDLMISHIKRKTGLGVSTIEQVLETERGFFKKLGVELDKK